MTAQAPSQPLDEAPSEDRRRDVAKAVAEAGGTAADAAAKPKDVAAAEEKVNDREQRGEPAQKDVTAQASSQPLDEAPPEDRRR